MKIATIVAVFVSLSYFNVFAQEQPKKEDAQKKVADAMSVKDLKGEFKEGWNKSTQFGVNFNWSGFNDQWKQINTGVVGNTNLNLVVNHQNAKLNGKNIWINDAQGNIGFLNQGGTGFNRNVDKLFLNSLYGRKLSDKLQYFAEANFISQFLPVKKDLFATMIDPQGNSVENLVEKDAFRSGFFNPAYLTFATGIEYKPKDYISFKIAPLANKFTFVTNKNIVTDADGYAYGVNVKGGKSAVSEFGSQLTVGFNKEVVKNVNLGFRYNIFQAWKKDLKADKSEGIKSLDHRLDLVATASINKYLSVNFTTIAIRDLDITSGWQFAGGFGVGLQANL
jgi:hypothetical protein